MNIEALREDIRVKGLREPIVVQVTNNSEMPLLIIDGERRFKACCELGYATIKCHVFPAGGNVVPCS